MMEAPYIPPTKVTDWNKDQRLSYNQMEESVDNQTFPPITVDRDPFVEWF